MPPSVGPPPNQRGLGQRRNQHVAEDCKIAVEIGVWPLLARHDLGDEVARCRIEDCREGHDTSIAREDRAVLDLELLRQALEGIDESDRPVAVVDRLVIPSDLIGDMNPNGLPARCRGESG